MRNVREHIPNAIGIENDFTLFHLLKKPKPNYIYLDSIEGFDKKAIDTAFVGWMKPGVDS